jgi:uncharacterized protein
MKAICIADVHGDVSPVIRLRNSITGGGFEYVFILGDFSQGFKDPVENKVDINRVLDLFTDFNTKAVPGNCDQRNSPDLFAKRNANLHNVVLKLPEANIMGFGGSNVTPFNTPLEYTEKEIADSLNGMHARCEQGSPVILLSHAPPKDTKCDVISSGLHVGSTALREFIVSKKPDLVLCSHIHECGGVEDKIGPTRVINIGRASDGWAYALTVEDTIEVEPYLG